MRYGWYHSSLRVSALVLVFSLLFVSGVVIPQTKQMTYNTQVYLANAVGVSVGVEPNELNQITAALTERERTLAEREVAITQREIEVGIRSSGGVQETTNYATYLLSSILFLVLVLIVINYVLDFRRERRLVEAEKSATA